jgi:hypothetical protein
LQKKKKTTEFSTSGFRTGALFSRKYFLSIVRIKVFSNFILFYTQIFLVKKISSPRTMQVIFSVSPKNLSGQLSPPRK